MGVGGQRHAPAALPPGETQYPFYRRLGGPQGRSGRVRKNPPPPPLGFDPWTVQPIASRCTDKAIPSHIEIDNTNQWRTQEFFWGGVSTNSVEGRENGDLGA
jgi:hypothetical protein